MVLLQARTNHDIASFEGLLREPSNVLSRGKCRPFEAITPFKANISRAFNVINGTGHGGMTGLCEMKIGTGQGRVLSESCRARQNKISC